MLLTGALSRPDRDLRKLETDQAVAGVKLQQYVTLPSYPAQREVVVQRMYKELTGFRIPSFRLLRLSRGSYTQRAYALH